MLLIRPLCEGDEPEFAEPLGIERLAGYLHEAGAARVTVMDRRLYQQERRAARMQGSFWKDVREACAYDLPSAVGLSLMTSSDVPDALRIISRVRGMWPQAQLLAGGLYVTTNPIEARKHLPSVVTLLRGEGEAALLAVVRELAGPGCVSAVREDGTEIPAETLTPDEWAQAYRPHIERYAALGCAVNMQTSRGCPGRCTFCATPSMSPELRRWKPRSLTLVVDEIEAEEARLTRAGLPPVFNFVDDDFGPLTRVEALVDELEHRQLRVAFALEMRLVALIGQPNLTERLTRLHQAGLTRVFFGVESLNPTTLRRWHKPYDLDALPTVVTACREAGITVQAGYILWHADQTVAGAIAEVEQLARLGIYSHRAAMSRLIVFPGCALAQEGVGEWGLQALDEQSQAFYQRFCEETLGFTQEWTASAVAEPYATAQAFLTGDARRVEEIRNTLRQVNHASLLAFRQLAHEMAKAPDAAGDASDHAGEVSS